MAVCEMCGSDTRLFKSEIEGTVLNVCAKCARFGRVIAHVHDKKYLAKIEKQREKREQKRQTQLPDKELTQGIVEDFPAIIKERREKLNLKQEDFAKKINEKVSLIHKIETGHFEPSIKLARKIERFLKVKLVETKDSSYEPESSEKSDTFTLGDFIKVRR